MRALALLALLLFVASCRVAQLDETLIYHCGPNTECEGDKTCVAGLCVFPDAGPGEDGGVDAGCVPSRSCEPGTCGPISDDGCGTLLDCGGCGPRYECGIVTPNLCDFCVPADAGELVCPEAHDGGSRCGSLTVDNCGVLEAFSCGPACSAGELCVDNVCCVPPSDGELCADAGFGCGGRETIDRCGTRRRLDCGLCPTGRTCVSDDVGSRCVVTVCTPEEDVEFCANHGANCGLLSAFDNCGAARTGVRCGDDCDGGTCTNPQPNQCVCQGLLNGCGDASHCCSGLSCSKNNLCCTPTGSACNDDADCCFDSCQLGACCLNGGRSCLTGAECCSGVCEADAGCAALDAGPGTWDGGEL